MPTFHHGKDSQVLVDEFDLSRYFRSFTSSRNSDVADTTGFGVDDKEYIPGMRDGMLAMEGMWSPTLGAVDPVLDEVFEEALGNNTVVFQVAPGGQTTGQPCIIGQSDVTQYDITQATGDIVTINTALQSTDGQANGTCIHPLATRTTTGVGTFFDSGATAPITDVDLLAVLNVTATDGTATIKVTSSTTSGGTYVDEATFNVTAIGGQSSVTRGIAVDRFIKASWTLGTATSITFALSFARLGAKN